MLSYIYRRLRLWGRFRRFWHTIFHFHCSIDIVYYGPNPKKGTTIIACQCGKIWGQDPFGYGADLLNETVNKDKQII